MKALYFLLPVSLITACEPTRQKQQQTAAIQRDTAAQQSRMEHQNSREAANDVPAALKQFIPAGYSVINMSGGDANLDKIDDCILVLKNNAQDTLSNAPEGKPALRPLLLITATSDGKYTLAARNDRAVQCYDCGGVFDDPFINTVIRNGYFTIEHGVAGGVHWESFTTFRYDKARNHWFLYKDHYTSYKLNERADEDAEALVTDADKLRTIKDFGEVRFDRYDTYKDR
jgi:hypothetical protein